METVQDDFSIYGNPNKVTITLTTNMIFPYDDRNLLEYLLKGSVACCP